MASRRTNPVTGYHPDLLPRKHRWPPGEQRAGATYRVDEDRLLAGETPVFVELSSLTPAQIAQIPVHAFTADEWAGLDKDLREEIFENDAASEARIDEFVALFVDQWKWEQDPERVDFNDVEAGFEYWLANAGDTLWRSMPDEELEAIVRYANGRGMDAAVAFARRRYGEEMRWSGEHADEVRDAINGAMENSNRYEVDMDTTEPVYSEERRGHIYCERSDYKHLYDALEPPEVERALGMISKATNYDIDLAERDLEAGRPIDIDWDTGVTIKVGADWEAIDEEVREAIDNLVEELGLEGGGPEVYEKIASAPPQGRVVYRWPDGFYVQDLLAEELPAEGEAMGMCVGRPEMGYMDALKRGEIKIMSLRRPSGKPLFTFELALGKGGRATKIEQVKGKANRLPGFDRGKAGVTPIKRDEVERVIEFIEGPLAEYTLGAGRRIDAGIAFEDVEDVRPAAAQVWELFQLGDPWARKLLIDKLKIERASQRLEIESGAGPRGNPAPSCAIHGARCGGFCSPYRRR